MFKQIKELFRLGGMDFMVMLTILLTITIAWYAYQFVVAYYSKKINIEKVLRKLGYGKSMGLFTLVFGISGSMIGFYEMFRHVDYRPSNEFEITPEMVFGAIKVTMIVTIYGIFIYLFSLLVWFIASMLIKKKHLPL